MWTFKPLAVVRSRFSWYICNSTLIRNISTVRLYHPAHESLASNCTPCYVCGLRIIPNDIRPKWNTTFVRIFSSEVSNTKEREMFELRNTAEAKKDRATVLMYIGSVIMLFIGLTFGSVPAYRAFCQQMGWGGKAEQTKGHRTDKVATMSPVRNRKLRVHFNADTGSSMRWNFKPLQKTIKLCPGETALAFYTARNPHSEPVTGISTYNVIPIEAGLYFNKIQCFCFEEQRLNPGEEVDMPVFFYIDPDICDDHTLENVDDIWLSYHFFEAKPGLKLPLPDEFVPVLLKSEDDDSRLPS